MPSWCEKIVDACARFDRQPATAAEARQILGLHKCTDPIGCAPWTVPRRKVALVTGAGSGIGAAIATTLADQGTTVYVGTRMPRQETVARRGGGARSLDVGIAAASSAAAERIVRECGLDILVNNAGILKTGAVADATIDDWDQVCG